jgi:CMP-N-acetylneuraminic acid synthetase
MNPLNVVAFIPARSGSKGLKDKNLRELAGISLIGRAVLMAKSIKTINHVVVTTDSETIAGEAARFGAEIPFMRSKSLAEDFSTTEVALTDALVRWESLQEKKVDLCVYFSPSEAYLNRDCVERGIQFLGQNSTYDSYFSSHSTTKNYWEFSEKKFERILDWMKTYSSRQSRQQILREDTGRGCVSRSEVWRSGMRIGDKVWMEVDDDVRANLDIHTEIDFKIATLVLSELGDHKEFSPDKIL